MRHITPRTLILAALALPFAGCGSDGEEHDPPEAGGTTTSGGDQPIVRGPAVIAYGDPDTQKELEPAVNACLS